MASWMQVCLVFGLFLYAQAIRDNSFKFRVPAGWYECFYEEFDSSKDERMELFYEVVKGSALDIMISVSSPDEMPIIPASIERRGHVTKLNTDVNGPYRICLDNTMSSVSAKVVYINIIVHEKSDKESPAVPSTVRKEDGNVSDSFSNLDASFHNIRQALTKVKMTQRHLSVRDSRHLETAESSNDRVLIWSLMEMMIMLTVFILQVYIVRCLFVDKKRQDGIRT